MRWENMRQEVRGLEPQGAEGVGELKAQMVGTVGDMYGEVRRGGS